MASAALICRFCFCSCPACMLFCLIAGAFMHAAPHALENNMLDDCWMQTALPACLWHVSRHLSGAATQMITGIFLPHLSRCLISHVDWHDSLLIHPSLPLTGVNHAGHNCLHSIGLGDACSRLSSAQPAAVPAVEEPLPGGRGDAVGHAAGRLPLLARVADRQGRAPQLSVPQG